MKITFYIIIFALIISSCKKDEFRKPVLAGVNDSNMFFYEFNPNYLTNFKTDTLLNLKFGIDSIDLNLDGKFDLLISQRFFTEWSDTIRIVNNNFPYCKLTLKNDLEVAIKNEDYYIGLGQTSNVDWVDTLQFENRIENITDWSKTNVNIWMWVIPPTGFWGSYGSWYNLINTEKYIGIRMKFDSGYKFGWIKINQINRENLRFLSYAIEK